MGRASTAVCRLAHEGWAAWSAPAARRFERALDDPEAAQWRVLDRVLRRNRGTAWGRRHGFASVRSVADFQARAPLVRYDDLSPWLERVRTGERGVLTSERVLRLVPSSGSSAARKLIPWTRSLAGEWGRAIQPWTYDLFRTHPTVKGGPAYWSVSPALASESDDGTGVPIGFDEDSAYLGGLLRPLVRATLAVPEEIRHVRETETFRYLTALGLLRAAGLRLVSVWHPSFFAILLDAVERHWPALVRDVASGTVTPPARRDGAWDDVAGAGPGAAMAAESLRPDPARARALERAGPAGVLWPDLTLLSCWTDGPSAGPAQALQRRLPGVTLQPKGLLATEGVVSVPFGGGRPLAVRSHFFEFLDAGGHAHTAADLREGEAYGVVLTTGGGLYRYRLGDRVRVEGFLRRTPCLRFVGREDGVSDLCGEKLEGAFVAGVLDALFAPDHPTFALLAPDTGFGGPGYTLYLDRVSDDEPADLGGRLDAALSANPHYRYCRRLGQLRPPAIFRIAGDGHSAYVEREAAAGRRIGDVKAAALSARVGWSEHFGGAYL